MSFSLVGPQVCLDSTASDALFPKVTQSSSHGFIFSLGLSGGDCLSSILKRKADRPKPGTDLQQKGFVSEHLSSVRWQRHKLSQATECFGAVGAHFLGGRGTPLSWESRATDAWVAHGGSLSPVTSDIIKDRSLPGKKKKKLYPRNGKDPMREHSCSVVSN